MIQRLLLARVTGWAWRNRARLLDWAALALRATESLLAGRGTADARVEMALRRRLRRGRRTRRSLVEVRVVRGVATIGGRLTPEEHAAVQDAIVRTPGIDRVEDTVSHVPGRGRRRRRDVPAATVALTVLGTATCWAGASPGGRASWSRSPSGTSPSRPRRTPPAR